MATADRPRSDSAIARRDEILAAIERNDIVRLLAEVDAGRIDREEFENALKLHRQKHWFRQIISAALGR